MSKRDSIIVEIDANQTIRVNRQPVSVDEGQTTLFAISSRRANKNMYIRRDARLRYEVVFEIQDIAKRSGAAGNTLPYKWEGSSSPPKNRER